MTIDRPYVNLEVDLTQDIASPGFEIVYQTNMLIHMVASDCQGNILDLINYNQIKVEAKPRYTSNADPIFTATLSNGKVTVVDSANGLFDVALTPEDTDFIGDAYYQVLFVSLSGEIYKSTQRRVVFRESFINPD